MKRLLNERFSWMMNTTWAIGLAVARREDADVPAGMPGEACCEQPAAASAAARSRTDLVVTDDAAPVSVLARLALEPHPVRGRLRSSDLTELARRLAVVERARVVRGIAGAGVARRQLRQAEVVFDVAQNARGLVLDVRNGAFSRVRGDDQQRHGETEPVVIFVDGLHGVEPSAPIVPHDEDRGGLPKLARADRVDDARDPGRAAARAESRGIGCR